MGGGYFGDLKFICFINILWQNLQLLASSFIVSSQNGHDFVLVLPKPIIDFRELNKIIGMPAGSNVTPKKVEPIGLPFLVT